MSQLFLHRLKHNYFTKNIDIKRQRGGGYSALSVEGKKKNGRRHGASSFLLAKEAAVKRQLEAAEK